MLAAFGDRIARHDQRFHEVVVFLLIWAGVLLLAIATEIGGLYFLDALR
jgi:hypothetical protein